MHFLAQRLRKLALSVEAGQFTCVRLGLCGLGNEGSTIGLG